MLSILFLIFLISITTFFSNHWVKSDLGSSLAAPIFILLGYIISPQILGLVLKSIIDSMNPALRVSIFLVAFIAGFRFLNEWNEQEELYPLRKNAKYLGLLSSFTALLIYFSIRYHLFRLDDLTSYWEIIGVGFILIGLFFKGWEMISVIFVVLGEAFWKFQEINVSFGVYFLLALSIALVLITCVVLIVGDQKTTSTPFQLALLGILILGTGLSTNASINEAFVGFLTGSLIYIFRPKRRTSTIETKNIETPLLLFIFFFMGLHLHVDLRTYLLGTSFAVARLFILWFLRESKGFTPELIKIQKMAIPLTFGIYLSTTFQEQAGFYLSVLTSALVMTEILGLPLLSKTKDNQA